MSYRQSCVVGEFSSFFILSANNHWVIILFPKMWVIHFLCSLSFGLWRTDRWMTCLPARLSSGHSAACVIHQSVFPGKLLKGYVLIHSGVSHQNGLTCKLSDWHSHLTQRRNDYVFLEFLETAVLPSGTLFSSWNHILCSDPASLNLSSISSAQRTEVTVSWKFSPASQHAETLLSCHDGVRAAYEGNKHTYLLIKLLPGVVFCFPSHLMWQCKSQKDQVPQQKMRRFRIKGNGAIPLTQSTWEPSQACPANLELLTQMAHRPRWARWHYVRSLSSFSAVLGTGATLVTLADCLSKELKDLLRSQLRPQWKPQWIDLGQLHSKMRYFLSIISFIISLL